MKQILPFFLLLATLIANAQVPTYYDDVDTSLTGTSLKDELAVKITNTHTTNLSYTPGVWEALQETDLDASNTSNVILIYGYNDNDGNYITDKSRSKDANGGTSGTQWNREHVFPKSLGNPNLGTSGPGADAHHLRAADITFNSQRGSLKFVDGSGNAGSTNGGWYPGDEWKGDVARMMMYVYLRYGDQCLPTAVGVGNSLSTDANMIDLFLEWNVEDPVSDFETQRNPILEGIQGNRNPFIDNPAFATAIWGGDQAEDLFGDTNTNNPDNGNGDSGGDSSSDLFISEYVEGSSNNKAIEIANFTGSSVNLSEYSIRKATNGSGSFSTSLTLSGTLANGAVYVIAHSSASSTITAVANITNASVTTFNGNDAIALYKNGSLIDLVGDQSSSANFAKDITLQRASSVTGPNTTYNTSEWNTLNKDTFSGLGIHTINGDSNNGNTDNDDTNDTPLDYCDAAGNDASFEYIDNVSFAGISNATSSNGGYGDFTSLTGNLTYGTNNIVVSAGFSSTSYTEYWKVWVDFNQNGTFDTDEEVVSGSSSSDANLGYTFTVPTSAISGSTRMRVAMKWDAAPTSCETFSYGEVEDYTVSIGAAKGISLDVVQADIALGNEKNIFDATVYPNPTTDTLSISLNDNREATFNIFNTVGQIVLKGKTDRSIDVSQLQKGIYLIEVHDGQRSFTKTISKE